MRGGRFGVCTMLLTTLAVGCSSGTTNPSDTSTPSSTSAPSPTLSSEPRIPGTVAVAFLAPGGVLLKGRLFGSGSKAAILSTMGAAASAQNDWWPLARALAHHGYLVLTYNYQGACDSFTIADCSTGAFDLTNAETDLLAAISFLRSRGIRRPVLVGGDLGATVSLDVAASGRQQLGGVVAVSGVTPAQGFDVGPSKVAAVHIPTLFVVGGADSESVATVQSWAAAANSPTQVLTFHTALHGTYMLSPIAPQDQPILGKLIGAVSGFMARYA